MENNKIILKCCGKGAINIALIKYWGKENEEMIVPMNNSISITLDTSKFCTDTTVELYNTNDKDELILNGESEDISKNKRLLKIIKYFRENCQDLYINNKCILDKQTLSLAKIKIISSNSFPTAAGCASSASSMSCLVKIFETIYNYKEKFVGDLTSLARQLSGSACRSMFGGIVEWEKNNKENNSVATQLFDELYFSDLKVLLIIVSDKRKDTSSTDGMKLSKETSQLFKYRIESVVPNMINSLKTYLKERNFEKIFEITMKDSNNFHAICRDSFPSICYMNDNSNFIIKVVDSINSFFKKIICAYTFDAGPNAYILTTKEQLEFIKDVFQYLQSNNLYNEIIEKSGFIKDLIRLKENNSYSFQQIVGKGSQMTSLQIMSN